jgi:alkanesulfonate monooxygenase SsuD/methylene tetrahydromethanopterin reductase-like flavin-dependent oxidoreductase (luciferase family)
VGAIRHPPRQDRDGDELDGARLAVVDPAAHVVYVWFGGQGVNVYDEHGREVDYFSLGGASRPSVAQVRAAIARAMAETEVE